MQMTPTETKLAKARTQLVITQPFIGTLVLNMKFVLNENIPARACTDGKTVWFKPSAVDEWTDEEVKFVVAHECFHPLLQHNFRLGNRNPRKWNMAGDYVINELLVEDGVGKMPENCLQNTNLYNAGNQCTEGIYDLLPDVPDDGDGDGDGSGDGNGIGDDIQYAQGSPADIEKAAQEAKVLASQAAQVAKMAGNLSAGMERFVKELLNPKVPWTDVLSRFLTKQKSNSRSWAKPNRRLLPQGIYLPSNGTDDAIGEIAIAVDCSGSITDECISQFAAEIDKIKQDLKPKKIHVSYFDSSISHYESYTQDDELDIKPHGGGGTAFSPIFADLLERDVEPIACVVLTDLYCSDFGPEPNYPVLWVSTHSDEAPWGEVVMM
jgi:predicted metal-dependent peptidase